MLDHLVFRDRAEAGRMLATRLLHLSGSHPLILALPRGGVPVAFEIARELDAELDLLMVRKLGAPGYKEVGVGAVVDGACPQVVLTDSIVRQAGASPEYIRAETVRQLAEIDRQRQLYRPGRDPLNVDGRTIIIVDDGIATGGTVRAALRGVRQNQPKHLALAVPVAPKESIAELESECDELICLAMPDPFYAVGAHYSDFAQTTDDQVIELLQTSRSFGALKIVSTLARE